MIKLNSISLKRYWLSMSMKYYTISPFNLMKFFDSVCDILRSMVEISKSQRT